VVIEGCYVFFAPGMSPIEIGLTAIEGADATVWQDRSCVGERVAASRRHPKRAKGFLRHRDKTGLPFQINGKPVIDVAPE
ncbi:hypothetical protein ACC687_41070, partial [Rhizobium ruizarguesonis]